MLTNNHIFALILNQVLGQETSFFITFLIMKPMKYVNFTKNTKKAPKSQRIEIVDI